MILKTWEELPSYMKNNEVKKYYEILEKRKISLLLKRVFDFSLALFGLIISSPILLVLMIAIKVDSKGPVFFRQVRVTQYGKEFRIYKFRTMIVNAEQIGTQITVGDDPRITRMGILIRKCRLDELPQLINVLKGEMSFVGTRPEVPRYVATDTQEMLATLLLPAGITSKASIEFKDENKLLKGVDNVDTTYINSVLPLKMKYNTEYIEKFDFFYDCSIIFETIVEVLGKTLLRFDRRG